MISQFKGMHRWLSNFWPCQLFWQGRDWPTVEHAYQAAKTASYQDQELIRRCSTPGRAKRLAKQVGDLRPDWDEIKLGVMEELLRIKFGPDNPELRRQLFATEDEELQEGNTWNDTFWGVDLKSGQGQNNLGKLLMKIRCDLTQTCTKQMLEALDEWAEGGA